MGWIRKKFKQIKKRVKKLLSTKLGRIIGGIGLSMAMGWAAGKLFEGAKTLFGGVAPPATPPPVDPSMITNEAVKQTTKETMAQTIKNMNKTLAESGKTLDFIKNPVNSRLEAFQKYTDLSQAADVTGVTSNIFTNNQTTAVTDRILDINNLPNVDISENITPEIDILDSAISNQKETRTKIADVLVEDSPKNIFESGQRLVKNTFEDTKNFFSEHVIPESPAELAGEGVRYGLEQGIKNYLADDEMGYAGPGQVVGVQTQGSMPQNQYLSDISNQYQASMNTTQVPTMNNVTNGAFYGNMSPQYLQNLNQSMLNSFMALPT